MRQIQDSATLLTLSAEAANAVGLAVGAMVEVPTESSGTILDRLANFFLERRFSYDPNNLRYAGRINTTTVDSISEFLRRQQGWTMQEVKK